MCINYISRPTNCLQIIIETVTYTSDVDRKYYIIITINYYPLLFFFSSLGYLVFVVVVVNRFQSVLNAIAILRRWEHITDALASFRWLRALERIKFKLEVIVYRALRDTAPQLCTCQTGCSTSLICRRDVEAGCARQPPVFSTSARRGVSLSAIALLLLLAHDLQSTCRRSV